MNFLSLFAGMGGFDLGLERAGMHCVGQVEIDPFCIKILTKHWPDVKRIKDIRDVKKESFSGAIDLICGGFPCQPFSVAGKQKGAGDDRHLWPEMVRVISEIRPRWVIGENVGGLKGMAELNSLPELETKPGNEMEEGEIYFTEGPGYLHTILEQIETLGYDVQTFIIPACAVDAPHQRDRVWILANAGHHDRHNIKKSRNHGPAGPGPPEREKNGGKFTGSGCGGGGVKDVANSTSRKSNGRKTGIMGKKAKGWQGINPAINSGSQDVANPQGLPIGPGLRPGGTGKKRGGRFSNSGGNVSNPIRQHANRTRYGTGKDSREQQETPGIFGNGCTWPIEPGMGRVAHGVPNRVDRLKGLGNAVVPQIPEIIGRYIIEIEENYER